MTDQAGIQAKIWRGYGKAARKLGAEYQFRRPAAGAFPGTALFTRLVSINAEDMTYRKPDKYGKATKYAVVDGTGVAPGDYFIGPEGTFFIAAMQPLLPILAVECNRTVVFARVPNDPGVGARGYSGMTARSELPYASRVPCSILQGTKGERNEAKLPADTRVPWWAVLVPAAVGTVQYGDTITDDLNQRYVVSSAELTALGYRITATLAVA
ncbi:hypothetical protein R5W24_000485 [Gemmata sp. JC717]|uniref:hypothetical protein n=1 Tax=Gemmata algarum TaxID=2975278 RepID=UPI0021BBB367|nr:hypothetical protein [Gemmata algarum]MDY3551409.1 hypothetical protein [Gemmata algarum]